jgi:membrane-bound lytic murein transglycosylase D
MHWSQADNLLRQAALLLACTPLVLLTGCPQDKAGQAAAPGKISPQQTAPVATHAAGTSPSAQAAARTAAQTVEDPARTHRIQQLIASAEQSYHNGVNNYRAGRLEAARADFDAAVDRMLTSGLDLKSDPQLSDEFEHLLDAVNSLEIAALKQGNGLSQPIEEAPLDAANEVTFPPNAALTAQLNAELKTTQSDFPLVVNDYVAGFISYYSNSTGGHAHLLRSLERAGKYKDMVSKALQEEGVPQDLIYLAVAESGFQPQALNAHTGAGGMWQFMPFAGSYGLVRNGWVDERFDPEKSSHAYARYMKTLYNQFGDWYLAMAAYNWGPGNVQRAVMRTGYADFWELYRRGNLPAETKNYVPGIIAAIIMAKNPARYGLDKLVPDPPVISDTVTVDYSIDLPLVADLTGATLQEIVALNPSLLRMSTPQDTPFDLHIPTGTLETFQTRVKEIPTDKRDTWRFHVVKAGESLESIASMLHARVADIAEANDIAKSDPPEAGDELVVPVTAVRPASTQHYRLRRGDTLITVADRFGVSVEDLRRWNHLSSNTVRVGHTLAVSEPVRLAPHSRTRRAATHTSRSRRSSKSSAASHASSHRTATKAASKKPKSSSKSKSKATR